MSQMSDYLENALINHIFRTATFSKPTTLAIALFTAAPSDAGGGTEVSGGSYARQALNPLDANWAATSGTNGTTSNSSLITFPTATANWGTITHIGIFDATSGGNLLFWGALTASKTVTSGDTFVISANQLSVTLA